MERIKEAMELARQQRAAAGVSNQAEPGSIASAGSPKSKIAYTQTRSFSPNESILRENRILMGSGKDPATRAMHMLRTQILQRMLANKWNSLAITSPGAKQGKTLTSINLAISLAREVSFTVLLADLDFHNPSIHSYFGYDPQIGLGEYLQGGHDLADVLFHPGIEHLVIVPTREPIQSSAELLSSPDMLALVEEMKTRYPERFVMFDLPPLLAVDDALSFVPYVDAVLLVLEEGVTTHDELNYSIDLLGDVPLLGTVLNKSNAQLSEAY